MKKKQNTVRWMQNAASNPKITKVISESTKKLPSSDYIIWLYESKDGKYKIARTKKNVNALNENAVSFRKGMTESEVRKQMEGIADYEKHKRLLNESNENSYKTVKEFEDSVDSFNYEIRTWKEIQDLNLDDEVNEKEFNKYNFYLRYTSKNNGWTEALGWDGGNSGDVSPIGNLDSQSALEVFKRGNSSGRIADIEYK